MQKWVEKPDGLMTHMEKLHLYCCPLLMYQATYKHQRNPKLIAYCLILTYFPDYSCFQKILVFHMIKWWTWECKNVYLEQMNGKAGTILLFVSGTCELMYTNKYKECIVDDALIQGTPLVHYLPSTLNFPMPNKSGHCSLRVLFC